jgi:serpin B
MQRNPSRTDAADDAFGADLFGVLTEQTADAVFSPVSVAAALRLALCGARGETAAELAAALRMPVPARAAPEAAADGLRSLSDLLQQVTADGSVTFRVANTAWVQSGLPLLPDFTAKLRMASATVASADFAGAHQAARIEINHAIEELTSGKITALLAPGAVTASTRLVLANAVYLKAAWSTPFPVQATRDAPFHPDEHRADEAAVTVPMMHSTETRAYLRRDGYQAVLLPYADHRLALAVVLPDGPLASLRPQVVAEGLGGLLNGTSARRVALSLPRFRLETGFGLIPALRRLGVSHAFGTGADFSGITEATRLTVSAVAHKAYIDVDEHGTEAAAATAVVMRPLAALRPPPTVEMTVDHPFLFALIDTTTTAPLFLGQLTHPRPPNPPAAS